MSDSNPTDTTISIGAHTYTLAPLSADKALRLFDIVAQAADEIGQVLAETNRWRAEQADANAVSITAATFDDPDAAAQLTSAGFTPERVAEAGGELRLPAPPDDAETMAHALPGAYRSLRDPMLNALAIVIAPGDELLDADDAGELGAYFSTWRRRIRAEATPDQLFDAFLTAYEFAEAQLRSEGGLGKAQALMMAAFGMTPEEQPPARQKSARKSPTRSRKQSGGAAENAS